ncbi:hypothetical protein [Kitasatospora griseola]|uniref:hypothetical protein n=1 Tax=Kitasatospora griseola TaxID=2064 RepID=UPI00365CBC23
MNAAPGGAVDRGALVLDRRLGQGGQGVVHRVANLRINRAAADGGWDVVYKEYAPALLPDLDAAALTAMVDLLDELSGDEGRWLCEKTAWPAAVVRKEGQVSGFLMRAAPDRFRFDFRSLSGAGSGTRRLANLEFLLNDDAYTAGIGLTVGERDRLLLLADLAGTLDRLHRIGIGVGDLSPKNLLLATTGPPECFLIDCDAMRLRGASVLPQAETPDWQLPAGEEKATLAGDVHKLALLAVRLIARDQVTTDPTALTALSPDLGELARRSLDPAPARRPSPAEWAECLRAAAPTVPTASAAPPADAASDDPASDGAASDGATAPQGRSKSSFVAPVVFVVLVLVLLAVMVARSRGTGDHAEGPGTTRPPTPSPTSASPTRTPAPVTTTPARTPTATFDPRSLDSAQTDRTPLTASALLPVSFTDSKGVTYTRNSGSTGDCPDDSMKESLQTALRKAGCDKQVVGTYIDANARIAVAVWVIPLADAQAADRGKQALAEFSITDWSLWCPTTGPGSQLCDRGTDIRSATQSGYRMNSHRYLLQSRALYINLTTDSSAEEWTNAAAYAAITEAGP